MHRQLLLLGLLRREDMHGYRLNEFIERDLAFCADIKKPTAYYLLDRLAAEGCIVEVDEGEQPSAGRARRKTYRITGRGERRFLALLRENLRRYEPSAFPGDMGIAFLDSLPPEEALALLRERQAAMQRRRGELQRVPDHGGALRLVVEHHVAHLEAELSWLERVIDWLAAQAGPTTRE